MDGDRRELELIRESIFRPEAEEEAKKSLLARIYSEVVSARAGVERAPNRGLLAPVPGCVEGGLCPDDMRFTYNAIRVLMARYMVRGEDGRFLETPSMVMKRVAEGFKGRVNSERLYRMLVQGRFVFNSPTLFNMYSDGAKGTLSACYVTPVYDSMEGIMDAAVVQALTFKWGGGQGFSFSELRPRWDVVRGTSGRSSGPMSFMRLYDTVTELVKQGGKRRGANMGIMHVWHPDIYTPGFDGYAALRNMMPPQVKSLIDTFKRLIDEVEREGYEVDPRLKSEVERLSRDSFWTVEDAGFIQAKKPPLQDANLTNFNISVGANDAFMEAVLRDSEWWMVNPRLTEDGGVYRIHYSVSRATGMGRLGRLMERHPWLLDNPYLNVFEEELEKARRKGLELVKSQGLSPSQKNVYTWKARAREIWREIVEAAWGGGDPGLYLIDNHSKWNPTPWLGVVVATNPCGEQPLYPFESCNLGSISLDRYVKDGLFDLDLFAADVATSVDALDAVIDLNRHPDPRQEAANRFTRKIGLGVMGLAEALAELRLPYDSDEAVAFTLIAMASLEVLAWKRSWELAAKLGHAPAFECRMWDWREMRCLERGRPEELLELHTPALVKAGEVARFEDGWLKLSYHLTDIPGDLMETINLVAAGRVEKDGSVRLIPKSTLERVAGEIFGFTESDAVEALRRGVDSVGSPRLLAALAVYRPADAWKILVEYGRRLGARAPRNTVTTTIAPTGTISIIAGTSSGVEPFFALVYLRQVAVGTFLEVARRFRRDLLRLAQETGASRSHVELVYERIRRNKGSLRWALESGLDGELARARAPRDFIEGLRKLSMIYPTSMDFPLWYHIAHQAAAQLYVDQAISKTVNLPSWATPGEVEALYLLAWLTGLKGFTIYRDESKGVQVIVFGAEEGSAESRLLRRRRQARAVRLQRLRLPKKEAEAQGEVAVGLTENSACKTCEL